MQILVNDKKIDINTSNLQEFLNKENLDPQNLVISLNNQIIHNRELANTKLKENDAIVFFQAIAGG